MLNTVYVYRITKGGVALVSTAVWQNGENWIKSDLLSYEVNHEIITTEQAKNHIQYWLQNHTERKVFAVNLDIEIVFEKAV